MFLCGINQEISQKQDNSPFTTNTTVYIKCFVLCDMKTYSAVSLLRRRSLPGEQDEFRAVLLQTLHVGLERLCGLVAAARVNWDANCAGCLFVDASCLQVQTTNKVLKRQGGVKTKCPIWLQQFNIWSKQSSDYRVQCIHQENTEIPEICHPLTAKHVGLNISFNYITAAGYCMRVFKELHAHV